MQPVSLQTGKVKISTCTYIADSGLSDFDLESIFEFIELDDVLLGVKYNNTARGDIKGTKTFYNQISARIRVKHLYKETNLKIFSNGKFQITGVKTEEHVVETIKIFMKKAMVINGFKKLSLIKHLNSGIIVNSENYEEKLFCKNMNINSLVKSVKFYRPSVSEEKEFRVIGEIKGTKFSINGGIVVYDDCVNGFVSEKHSNRIRKIYSVDGEEKGYYKYEMLYNRKHLVLHGVNYKESESEKNTWEIYNSFGNMTGLRRLFLYDELESFPLSEGYNIIESGENNQNDVISQEGILRYSYTNDSKREKYNTDDINSETINVKISNMNCSFQVFMKPHDVIDKIRLHNLMNSGSEFYKGVSCHYKADSRYQAVCFRFYVNEKEEFVSLNEPGSHRITATIFKSGKTMLSGCLSKKHILSGRKKILEILGENYENIIVKKINLEELSTSVVNDSITIWDL